MAKLSERWSRRRGINVILIFGKNIIRPISYERMVGQKDREEKEANTSVETILKGRR